MNLNTLRKVRILFIIAALEGSAAIAIAAQTLNHSTQRHVPLTAALRPFEFLIGDWLGAPGKSGETGGFVFKSDVQGRVIVRTNFALYPAVKGKPALRHDDLMVIFADKDAIRADYFDSEGHVIRYTAQSPTAREVIFVSEAKPGEPRYRLRYVSKSDGSLSGNFDIAPPGEPGVFSIYLSWSASRAK